MTQTVPDISPLMPMHQDPLLVCLFFPDLVTGSGSANTVSTASGLSATQREACMRSLTTQKPKGLPRVIIGVVVRSESASDDHSRWARNAGGVSTDSNIRFQFDTITSYLQHGLMLNAWQAVPQIPRKQEWHYSQINMRHWANVGRFWHNMAFYKDDGVTPRTKLNGIQIIGTPCGESPVQQSPCNTCVLLWRTSYHNNDHMCY